MSALPYIPLFVADYLADTSHLSTLEHGAYLLLIMNYWQRGQALPGADAALARIARVSEKEWAKIKPSIAPFFGVTADSWTHGRIESELEKVRSKSATRARAGQASAAARSRQKTNTRSTYVEQTANYTDTDTDAERNDGRSAGARIVSHETENPQTDQLAHLETLLREASGWQREPAPGLFVTGEIQGLIEAGADLQLDVLDVVKAHAPQCRRRSSWRYFVPMIVQARDDRINAGKLVSIQRQHGSSHDRTSSRSNIATILSAVPEPGRAGEG